jgi:exopolysaccharide biosynthesis polyprenyl glycosylphosphotransferase
MNKKLQIALHVAADFISASAAWCLFFLYRKHILEAGKHDYDNALNTDFKLWLGLVFIPLFWILLYAGTGYYRNIFRRSRLREVEQTLVNGSLGCLLIFFVLLLDDSVGNYRDYYQSLLVYSFIHLGFTLVLRLTVASRTILKIQKRKWGYNTVMVGNGLSARKLYSEVNSAKKSEGFFIRGFLSGGNPQKQPVDGLPCLGEWKDLPEIIALHRIEDVIVCLDDEDHNIVPSVVDLVQNSNVHLKILPDSYGMVLGMVKMNNILGAMLVEVDFETMPPWQKTLKRIFDVLLALLALLLLIPVFAIIAFSIKLDSKGPIFYFQERIGFRGRPFRIIKFRSMKVNAETQGPQLSKENDDRRTRVGTFLRKTRLDEIPQFMNVLAGSMSIVGPRPERKFFIDQIVQKAPYYTRLHRIKPGITSWGQVKFGYAENVDEMVERMKYDILYLENMSLGLDIKIMIYTVLIIIQGRGK